jgi:DNA-binding MarR family transcriptional regulator
VLITAFIFYITKKNTLTPSFVLKRLQIISKKHKIDRPTIAVDSLALDTQLSISELVLHLQSLEQEGLIGVDKNSVFITAKGQDALV